MARRRPQSVLLGDAVHEFIIDRRLQGCTPATIRFYQQQLGYALRPHLQQQATEVSTAEVKQILGAMMDRGLKPTSINCAIRALKAFFRYLEAEGFAIAVDPGKLRKVNEPKVVPRVLQPAEIGLMVEAARSPRDRLMILLLADTGMRAIEFCRLRIRDVDLDSGMVRVYGKGQKERMLSLSLVVQKEMLRWCRLRKLEAETEDEPLFPSRCGGHMWSNNMSSMVGKIARRAGLEGVTTHTFRRTLATHWAKQGNLFHLAAYLGHSSLDMVRRYAQTVDEAVFEEHARVSPVVRKRRGPQGR